MLVRFHLFLVFLATSSAWSQAAPSATGYVSDVGDESPMRTPPPISSQAYPVVVGSEARSNYLRGGLVFSTAYNDNLIEGSSTSPVSDVSYSIWPTIAVDQTTPRLHETFTYSPGVTLYQKTSARNEQDQNFTVNTDYRVSPHMTASVQDHFRKSTNVLNQSDPLSNVVVSGSVQSPIVAAVAPFANQLNNTAAAEYTYQYSRNDMIGGSGLFANLHYSDPSQVPGLYDSESRGGSVFYNHRLSQEQYGGAIYQYAEGISTPLTEQEEAQSEAKTNSVLLFYTIYLKSNLSLSVLAGPQHYEVSQSLQPITHSWAPAVMASIGWHVSHASFATNYSHIVAGAAGLLGAYRSNNANLSAQWQASRAWSAGVVGSYTDTKNVSSSLSLLNPGGEMISGGIVMHHQITERLNLDCGYSRLHQNYSSIAILANTPNADREYISVSYQFIRSLGR
jgi:hypothetical protein